MLVHGGSASFEQILFALLPRALRAGLLQSVVSGLFALLVDGLPRPRFWLLLLIGFQFSLRHAALARLLLQGCLPMCSSSLSSHVPIHAMSH